jgi:hypothetical protein
VEGRTHAQAISTDEGKSDWRKGDVVLVADEEKRLGCHKSENQGEVLISEELRVDWGILPCETLEGRVTEPGIQDPESFYEPRRRLELSIRASCQAPGRAEFF